MPDSAPAPLGWLRTAPVVRVLEVPRSSIASPSVDSRALLASLFHTGADPVGLVWSRGGTGGPVELVGLGRSVFPPSVRVVPVDGVSSVIERFAELPAWLPLTGRFDGLTASSPRGSTGPKLEDGLLSVWTEPFALAVVAAPVRGNHVAEAVDEVADRMRYAKQRMAANPDRAIEHERLRAWYRELRSAESTGLWRVGVYAGGVDPAAASAVAALTVGSIDVANSGYVLTSAGVPSDLEAAFGSSGSTFLAGSELLAALTRLPSEEVPGLRLVSRPEFDITPEAQSDGGGLELGAVLDQEMRPGEPLTVPLSSLNRHTFVSGATGSGKSQTVRHLLESATTQGIPWLVLEPAKAEYARMANRIPGHEVIVVRPGDPESVPAGIDPLRPVDGFPLQTHVDLVRALFLAAFDADEPFPQVLAAALTRAYEEQGWDIALGESRDRDRAPRYPTLADLEQTALRVVEEVGYGREVANNVRGFVRVRLGSLRLGTTGLFLERGHPLDIGRLLTRNVVLEIEDVGDDRDKSFLIGTVLIAITEHLRMAERKGTLTAGELRHLTVIEEAHRLLRRTDEDHRQGAAARAVEMFASLLAEVRSYGEGLVIAEQIPAKLIPDAIKNTAVKLVHRLPARDDRDAVGATMNLSDAQSSYLVTLRPGTAAAFTDGMDHPLLLRMPDGTARENASPPAVYGPDEIVRSTSGRCAADYGLLGTTLADLVRGQRVVEENPLLRWVSELAVVAHLLGTPMPSLGTELPGLLERVDTRVLACGLAYAVDEAVAVRSGSIVDRIAPAGLAEHVYGSLSALVDGTAGCSAYEPEWVATPYIWDHTYADLLRHDGPDEELARIGELRRRAQTALGARSIVLGVEQPSALERSVSLLRDDPGWPETVRQILDELDAGWAEWQLLVPSEDGP